jgi:hypothetical protein
MANWPVMRKVVACLVMYVMALLSMWEAFDGTCGDMALR